MLNLSAPPYRDSLDLLSELRTSPESWDKVRFSKTKLGRRGTYDAHEDTRARVVLILQIDAPPADGELLRFLLDQEIAARRADSFQGAGHTLRILSMLLLERPEPEDILRFWSAKKANFDTWAGGYDVENVFAVLPPAQTLALLRAHLSASDIEMLDRLDIAAITEALPRWRAALHEHYPRSLDALTSEDCESWAERFGDMAGLEHFGMRNATTPSARAYLYRQLDRYEDAVACWREQAREATTSWDRISALSSALTDAARVPLSTLAEAEQIDTLRGDIDSWSQVGLGRMATQACCALSAAVGDDACGRALWAIAQRWRASLDSFTLVGLEAAKNAADRWGSAAEVAEVTEALAAERARIDAMFR